MCSEAGRTVVSGRVTGEGGAPVVGADVVAMDRESGVEFAATTGETGIYALLLPPKRTYVIRAMKDGLRAVTARDVEQTVSKMIVPGGTAGTSVVSSLPFTDLSLAEGSGVDDAWLSESASQTLWTGKWSENVAYGADGRAFLDGNVVFTPYSASTGSVVTVETKAQFFKYERDYTPDAEAQTAIRLGANGGFQVWTMNGWVDVAADGVVPTNGEEYTVRVTFDYEAGTFGVEVATGLAGYARLKAGNGSESFPLASSASGVGRIAFVGSTYFVSLAGDCRCEISGFAADDALILSNNVQVVLDAAKAEWLNKCANGDKTAVQSAVAGLSADDFNKAYLLNLDVTEDTSCSFEVTDIVVGTESVTISVSLVRTGKIEQRINGALKFYGAATLAAFADPSLQPLSSEPISDEAFSGGDTASATYPKVSGSTTNTFFRAQIEGSNK